MSAVELRFTINFKLTSETNTSTTAVVLIGDEQDAVEQGARVQRLTSAFMEGFNKAGEQSA